jgi:hypothetical protein
MPRSISKASVTPVRPTTENKFGNIIAVTINAVSMRPSSIINMEEIIIPDVQAQLFFLNVPYEKMNNRHEKKNQVIVDRKAPK